MEEKSVFFMINYKYRYEFILFMFKSNFLVLINKKHFLDHFGKKSSAQGTVEYLVIISVVVVLALIVVGLLINQTASVSDVSATSGEIGSKVGVSGISLGSSVAGIDGNGLMIIKNNTGENLTLTKVIIDGVNHSFSEQIVAGDEKDLKLHNIAACDSSNKSKSYSVKIEYVSSSGLIKTSDFKTITIDCTNIVTSARTSVEEDRTLIWRDGNALSFDGADDRVSVTGLSSAFTTEATFNAWVRLNRFPNGSSQSGFVSLSVGSPYTHYPYIDHAIYSKIFRANRVSFSDNGFDFTQWHMITVTTKPGDNGYVVYQNGTLIYSTTGESTVSLPSTIKFGENSGSDNLYGMMDEVTLFNRTLSADEVLQLYNSAQGLYADESVVPFNSGLVATYHFDEGSGSVAIDSAGDHNGTIQYGPTYVAGKVGYYE